MMCVHNKENRRENGNIRNDYQWQTATRGKELSHAFVCQVYLKHRRLVLITTTSKQQPPVISGGLEKKKNQAGKKTEDTGQH